MRRETYTITGGADGVRLIPETPDEAAFTTSERAIVDAMLHRWTGDGNLARQLESASVTARDLTGYGAFILLHVPAQLRGDSRVIRNGCAAMNFWWNLRDDSGLDAMCLADEGLLTAVELFPVEGQSYTVDECERILTGPVQDLTFRS